MNRWMIIVGLVGAIALAFGVGQRAQADKDGATTCERCAKKADCPHCDKGGECPYCKHGHHGKYAHKWEYKCVAGPAKGRAKRASENTAAFNKLGAEGWRLAASDTITGDAASWCFMRPKRN